ncbi:DUF4129 domain-containing protein [Ideonella sp. BN130291]|uniref:DUF4129 domain-containing protein n=1 Tax=Ideonella sp. BN130291 TaxID=3112940 RepID=UPI002E25A242|nr:DUF4129 domain-containing protein [Ideonella sp. BN130291]
MPSVAERSLVFACCLATAAAAAQPLPEPPQAASAAEPASGPAASAPPARASSAARAQLQASVEAVRRDPLLSGKDKVHELRLKRREQAQAKDKPPSWLKGLSRWLSESGRLLVWALGAIAVALTLVSLRHWWRWRADTIEGCSLHLPTHVHDLDIRPDSLPADVGAAAAALWQAGRHRDALSLLYRGALSRLVHLHAVPIRSASTEGDCLRLASAALPAEGKRFFERLVQAWQLHVYAARQPEDAAVAALCADFDACLGAALPATGSATREAAP